MLILATTLCAYALLSNIPFLYYEVVGIEQNPKLIDDSLFWQSYFNFRGLFYKPLSLLSYHLNHGLCGPSSVCFHWTNFFIHLANVVLIFFLSKKIGLKHFVFCTLFFALHPLATACVSQIHGRPYALGSFFMLLALNFNFSNFNKKTEKYRSVYLNLGIVFLFFCMFLSKQSFIIFPLIFLFHSWNTINSKQKTYLYISLTTLCLCFLIGIFYLDIVPNISKAIVSPKIYLISQLGNALTLIQFYFFPFQTALVHDLYFYASVFYLEVMTGILLLTLWIFLIVKHRSSLLGWLFFSFLFMIIPTNSIIPKNEVIREWRLYPSLIFLSLLWAYGLDYIDARLKCLPIKKGFKYFILYVPLMLYSILQLSTVYKQNQIYTDPILAWQQVTQHYPYSSDAYNNIGVWYARQKNYKTAQIYFKKAISLDPKNFAYELNMAACYREMQQPALNRKHTAIAKKKASVYNNRSHSFHLKP
ncbi:MAG TPA: tetratricopeptide repeat protein [Oligoflexia bacterium]|nr:tetratricopeptide repeat protein [Oligoflexia bacterium]